jgi:hypothetical protein
MLGFVITRTECAGLSLRVGNRRRGVDTGIRRLKVEYPFPTLRFMPSVTYGLGAQGNLQSLVMQR